MWKERSIFSDWGDLPLRIKKRNLDKANIRDSNLSGLYPQSAGITQRQFQNLFPRTVAHFSGISKELQ